GLDRRAVVQLPGAHRLPQCPAGRVLVGDVDVARVARARVCAQAALVPELRRHRSLSLRPLPSLALARDDLQGDVEPRGLVPSAPPTSTSTSSTSRRPRRRPRDGASPGTAAPGDDEGPAGPGGRSESPPA